MQKFSTSSSTPGTHPDSLVNKNAHTSRATGPRAIPKPYSPGPENHHAEPLDSFFLEPIPDLILIFGRSARADAELNPKRQAEH